MGVLLTMILGGYVGLAVGAWSVYRLLDVDSQYDVRQWFSQIVPFYPALHYRVRFWWRHKIRRLPIPEPYDGPIPNYVAELYKLSPTSSPFVSMVDKPQEDDDAS